MPFLVEMKNPEHMNKGIIESVDSIIQNEIELFIKSIRERKEELLKRLELVDNIDSLLKKESIDKIKSNYNIEYQKDTGKITLQSKTDVSNDIIHDSIGLFKQTVKAKFDKFTNDFENLEFTIKSSFEFENWLVHKNLSLEKHGKGILFSRRGSDVYTNYFTAINQIPLENSSQYKITIKSINEKNRYLCVGLFNEEQFQKTKETLISQVSDNIIRYYGYGHNGGLDGRDLATKESDPNGFCIGSEFFINYRYRMYLKIFNKEGSLDLKMPMKKFKGKFYLFVIINFPEASCVIEKLN